MKVQSWKSHDGEHVIVISDLTLRAWQRATLALFDVRAELEDEEPTIVRPRASWLKEVLDEAREQRPRPRSDFAEQEIARIRRDAAPRYSVGSEPSSSSSSSEGASRAKPATAD